MKFIIFIINIFLITTVFATENKNSCKDVEYFLLQDNLETDAFDHYCGLNGCELSTDNNRKIIDKSSLNVDEIKMFSLRPYRKDKKIVDNYCLADLKYYSNAQLSFISEQKLEVTRELRDFKIKLSKDNEQQLVGPTTKL